MRLWKRQKPRFGKFASSSIQHCSDIYYHSLLVSAAKIAAGLNGIIVDLLDESITNAACDVGDLQPSYYSYWKVILMHKSLLGSKGGELASLPVRGKTDF